MSDRPTPETDAACWREGFGLNSKCVHAEFARKLERERDEAREENKKFREALEWIAKRYDDSKPTHAVAMDAYEMSCTAKASLRKEGAK